MERKISKPLTKNRERKHRVTANKMTWLFSLLVSLPFSLSLIQKSYLRIAY